MRHDCQRYAAPCSQNPASGSPMAKLLWHFVDCQAAVDALDWMGLLFINDVFRLLVAARKAPDRTGDDSQGSYLEPGFF